MTEDRLGAWYQCLKEEADKPYFHLLKSNLTSELNSCKVYPAPSNWFRAFKLTDPSTVKVVIIGQDPYPNSSADGLAFSTTEVITPFSLRMIFREIDRDIAHTSDYKHFKTLFPTNRLDIWAKQGVLLINPVLTVKAGIPGSHRALGWQNFTNQALLELVKQDRPVVWMAWGADALQVIQTLAKSTSGNPSHLVLTAGHPASGAYGKDKFSGCGHFSTANEYFTDNNLEPINWTTNEEQQQSSKGD